MGLFLDVPDIPMSFKKYLVKRSFKEICFKEPTSCSLFCEYYIDQEH